ncbi:MAG: hypothetical protein ACLTSX_02035 [Collinsella sp.]
MIERGKSHGYQDFFDEGNIGHALARRSRIAARLCVAMCPRLGGVRGDMRHGRRPCPRTRGRKLTRQPNGDAGSEVLGGTETRITWEVQADADEELTGLSLTVPEGTSFTTEDLRLTMLSGEDLMERAFIEPKIKVEGETLELVFPEAAPAGAVLPRRALRCRLSRCRRRDAMHGLLYACGWARA